MAKKTVKKAARKQAKTQARRPVKRTASKSKTPKKAKAKAVSKPVKKTAAKRPPVKARKVAKPMKTARPRKAAKPMKAAKPVKTAKPVKKVMARTAPTVVATKATKATKAKAPAPMKRMAVPSPPTLQRERRRLPEAEDEAFNDVSEDSRLMSSARAGHDELRSELKQHTESSPEMTAGDVDAKWQDAYALGDEAPGGDNMTPDQDRVDDIGKALGIEYADDEELLGGEELVERDEHRWELDPASKEDDEEL